MSRDLDMGLILARLNEVLAGQRRLESTLEASQRRLENKFEDIAHDTDAIDRYNRPYGDGTRLTRRRSGGR